MAQQILEDQDLLASVPHIIGCRESMKVAILELSVPASSKCWMARNLKYFLHRSSLESLLVLHCKEICEYIVDKLRVKSTQVNAVIQLCYQMSNVLKQSDNRPLYSMGQLPIDLLQLRCNFATCRNSNRVESYVVKLY